MPLVGWPMRCLVSAIKAIFCETVSIQLVGKLQQCMKTQIPYKTVYKSAGLLYKIYGLETVNLWQILAIGAEEDLCAVSWGQTECHVIKMKLISPKLANWTDLMLLVNAEQPPNDSVRNPRPSWAFPQLSSLSMTSHHVGRCLLSSAVMGYWKHDGNSQMNQWAADRPHAYGTDLLRDWVPHIQLLTKLSWRCDRFVIECSISEVSFSKREGIPCAR